MQVITESQFARMSSSSSAFSSETSDMFCPKEEVAEMDNMEVGCEDKAMAMDTQDNNIKGSTKGAAAVMDPIEKGGPPEKKDYANLLVLVEKSLDRLNREMSLSKAKKKKEEIPPRMMRQSFREFKRKEKIKKILKRLEKVEEEEEAEKENAAQKRE